MLVDKDYFFKYEETYDPDHEEGWAICDAQGNQILGASIDRQGYTLQEIFHSMKQSGKTVYLGKELPQNYKQAGLFFERNSFTQTEIEKLSLSFRYSLFILSQFSHTKEMVRQAIDEDVNFIFQKNRSDDAGVLVRSPGQNDMIYLNASLDSISILDLVRTIGHELHHRQQSILKHYYPLNTDGRIWDLQSAIFLTRIIESEALLFETVLIEQIKETDHHSLFKRGLGELGTYFTSHMLKEFKNKPIATRFAAGFMGAFSDIVNYDRRVIRNYGTVSDAVKQDAVSIREAPLDKIVYDGLSVHGTAFGAVLKEAGINLLDDCFFGLQRERNDPYIRIEESLRSVAPQSLSGFFKECRDRIHQGNVIFICTEENFSKLKRLSQSPLRRRFGEFMFGLKKSLR